MEKFEIMQPEKAGAEQPKADTQAEELQKLKEDAKARFSRVKDWEKWWIKHLAPEAENLPEEIKDVIERGQAITPEIKSRFEDYVAERIARAELNPSEPVLQRFRKEEDIVTILKPEKDPAVNKAQNELKQTLHTVEKVNADVAKQENIPLLSSQEQKDLKTKNVNTAGGIKYWKNRLLPELDILPPKVQEALQDLIRGAEHLSGDKLSVFHRYINKRIAILELNVKKRVEMARLKFELKNIDQKIDYNEKEKRERQTIFYDENKNKLFTYEGENKKPITFGDIVADCEWGIRYQPDSSVPEKHWRKIRKLADLTTARRNIEKIFNQELMKITNIGDTTTTMSEEFLEKLSQDKKQEVLLEGAVAERMVKNFLTRIQYNNPDLGLRVESANVLEDAELKYDFKILLPEKRRGVAIEGDGVPREEFLARKRKLGVQFTISHGGKTIAAKRHQIEEARKNVEIKKYANLIKKPVDDIILMSLDLGTYLEHFKEWLKSGKPSGGPEQYLTREEKIRIFKEATRDFLDLSDEQIDKLAF